MVAKKLCCLLMLVSVGCLMCVPIQQATTQDETSVTLKIKESPSSMPSKPSDTPITKENPTIKTLPQTNSQTLPYVEVMGVVVLTSAMTLFNRNRRLNNE